MCTIVVVHDAHPDRALIVAANRDEVRARAAGPPAAVAGARLPAVAGVDRVAGGTWMGANRAGFFVGLTNQRTFAPPAPDLRSRGMLALEALRLGRHDAVIDWLASGNLDARAFNDFNLVFGEPGRVSVAYGRRHDAEPLTVAPIPTGIHVLANDRIGSPHFPRADRARDLAAKGLTLGWPAYRDHLEAALGDTRRPPLEAIETPPPDSRFDRSVLWELQALCILTPWYGTVSATVLAADRGRGLTDYRFAAGPPSTAAFADVPHP